MHLGLHNAKRSATTMYMDIPDLYTAKVDQVDAATRAAALQDDIVRFHVPA